MVDLPRRILLVVLTALALGLGLVAPAAVEAGDDVEKLVQDLGNPLWKTRSAAYRTLIAKLDPEALPHLRRKLPGHDFYGQYYGVLVLNRYPAARTKRAWRAFLECDAPYLRFCAGTALLRSGDDDGLEAAISALTDAKTAASLKIRMLAGLSVRSHPRLLDGMRTLLEPGQNLQVLLAVFGLIHRMQDQKAVPHVQRVLGDERRSVQAVAAAYLYELGQIGRAGILARAFEHGIPAAEFAAIRKMLPASRRVADTILAAVTQRLKTEKNAKMLVQLMDFLQTHKHAGSRPALKPLLSHPNATVARKAFDVLVALSGPVRQDTLRPLLAGEDVGRRLWAAEALRQLGDTSGIGTVISALERGTIPQRKDAARILSGFTMDLAVGPLLDALSDDHVQVRAAALAGLQRLLPRLFPYRVLKLSSTGYAPQADAATRANGVKRIRQWWERSRNADW